MNTQSITSKHESDLLKILLIGRQTEIVAHEIENVTSAIAVLKTGNVGLETPDARKLISNIKEILPKVKELLDLLSLSNLSKKYRKMFKFLNDPSSWDKAIQLLGLIASNLSKDLKSKPNEKPDLTDIDVEKNENIMRKELYEELDDHTNRCSQIINVQRVKPNDLRCTEAFIKMKVQVNDFITEFILKKGISKFLENELLKVIQKMQSAETAQEVKKILREIM